MDEGKLHPVFGATLVAALLVSGAGVSHADIDRTPRIIRPPDDRADYFAASTMLQGIGDAVCAQMGNDILIDNGDGTFTIDAGTLATDFAPLCDGERFGDQPTAANCTATLVAPDVLITAGHCLDEGGFREDLTTLYFVFDYAIREEGVFPATFTSDQVYQASEILGLANQEGTANDWAVLKLDREVTGRTPVGVRSSGAVAVGQSIVAIGYGAGLPIKFSDNATVQGFTEFGFEADLDIIVGNSGGPIIDATTGMIEGVVSADQAIEDYIQDGACFRASVCPQDPDCDDGFTLLSSVMTAGFQAAIRNAISGTDDGGTDDGGTDDGGTDDGGTDDGGTGGDDADNDGVDDEHDFCPETPAGTDVDEDGCEFEDDGTDVGETPTGPAPCGVLGFIPFAFMMLGLTLLQRRRF